MKKSDFLEDIELYIRARFQPKSNPRDEAEHLLQRIEHLGMKPTKHVMIVDDEQLGKRVMEVEDWEPEEQKDE